MLKDEENNCARNPDIWVSSGNNIPQFSSFFLSMNLLWQMVTTMVDSAKRKSHAWTELAALKAFRKKNLKETIQQ